jgi:hypothetical protein
LFGLDEGVKGVTKYDKGLGLLFRNVSGFWVFSLLGTFCFGTLDDQI